MRSNRDRADHRALPTLFLTGLIGPAVGLTFACSVRAGAQEPPPPLTLDQAFASALKQHPALQQSEAQVGAAKARTQQARAGMMPSLVLQGTATDGPLGAPAFGPIGNPALYGAPPLSVQGMAGDPVKKQFGGGLNITQTLFDFGRTQHLVAARKGLAAAAEQDAEAQQAMVLLGVQQAYLNVLRAQQSASVLQQNRKQREDTVAQARIFVEGQLKSGVDLQIAESDLSEAEVALIAAQNDVHSAFAALNNAMGETKLTEYKLTPLPAANPSDTSPQTVEQAITLALAHRPETRSAALLHQAADQSVKGVRSELQPRVDAIASLGVVNPSGVIQNSKNYAVGMAVSIPLYTGGLVEGRIAEEKQKRDVVIAQEKEIAETIKLQVTQAWLSLQTQQAQVRAAQAAVASTDASLQLASERYRLQLNTLVELTDAEALSVRARALLVNAQYGVDQAQAALDWAVGATYRRYAQRPGRH